ncbi:MAG: glycoside hydrolase family 2 protein, partial [Spirochaetaceae bacterium]|nr:glycoside hydrolase family 2 protein [Spirochaetaceae bacterium]
MRRIGLEGSWELVRLFDGSRRPLTVPGDIMSALITSGELADPYYAANELKAQWVGREDWLLVKEIDLDPDFLDLPRIFIEFEVLDTIAELRVNGALLGRSSNMFERFRAEAREALRPGRNTIEVLLRSPEIEAEDRASRLSYALPYSEYPVTSPHRNLVRKAQCMAGWDWGPCLMTGGVYDGAALVGTSGARIEYATTRAKRLGEGSWALVVAVELSTIAAMDVEIEVEVSGERVALRAELPPGASMRELSLTLSGIEPWWPAGYGAQPLYDMIVRCAGALELRKRLGFRELEVVAREDEIGKSMIFRVNGRDIFCKGSNWIPADALPSRWTRERLD